MAAIPLIDLPAAFERLEAHLETLPKDQKAEILLGILCMSPRPGVPHSAAQTRISSALHEQFGRVGSGGDDAPEWLFLVEPELRDPAIFTRVVPDIAGWKRSASGWPARDAVVVGLTPEWVCEIRSPGTAADDRTRKAEVYGAMGVPWLWLVDTGERCIDVLSNERGKMVAHCSVRSGGALLAPPFGLVTRELGELFY